MATFRNQLDQQIGEVQLPEAILEVDAQVRFSWIAYGGLPALRGQLEMLVRARGAEPLAELVKVRGYEGGGEAGEGTRSTHGALTRTRGRPTQAALGYQADPVPVRDTLDLSGSV